MAERVTRFLAERLGSRQVAAHHGSLAKELRLDAEQRLKAGQLKVLVATASLELGIDIGDVELVCQLSSPRSIAAFLQRVGRSGHSVGGTPRAGCSRPPATTWWNARRCSTACAVASWTAWCCHASRWTCWRSRSSPKWPARSGARTTSIAW